MVKSLNEGAEQIRRLLNKTFKRRVSAFLPPDINILKYYSSLCCYSYNLYASSN